MAWHSVGLAERLIVPICMPLRGQSSNSRKAGAGLPLILAAKRSSSLASIAFFPSSIVTLETSPRHLSGSNCSNDTTELLLHLCYDGMGCNDSQQPPTITYTHILYPVAVHTPNTTQDHKTHERGPVVKTKHNTGIQSPRAC